MGRRSDWPAAACTFSSSRCEVARPTRRHGRRRSGACPARVRYRRAIKRIVLLSLLLLPLALPAPTEAHTLTRARAKAAVQHRANQIAHRRVRITRLYSTRAPAGAHGTHAYSAEARWRQVGSGVPCFADLRIRFTSSGSSRVIVRLRNLICS
jgi:hypothetical protein